MRIMVPMQCFGAITSMKRSVIMLTKYSSQDVLEVAKMTTASAVVNMTTSCAARDNIFHQKDISVSMFMSWAETTTYQIAIDYHQRLLISPNTNIPPPPPPPPPQKKKKKIDFI